MAFSKVITHGDHPAMPDMAPPDTSTAELLIGASARMMNITETREMIMRHLDPLSMSHLISVHSGALATFQQYPVKFLNACLCHVPSGFAITILDALEQQPSEEVPVPPEVLDALYQSKRACAMSRDEYLDAWGGLPETELERFLMQDVRYPPWNLEAVKDPLRKLQQLAQMHDAVETLASSRIWSHVDDPEIGAGLQPNGRWESEIDEIRDVLWIYQLYCVIFRETGVTESGEALFPSIGLQERFFSYMEKDLIDDEAVMSRLYSVYEDLSSFLGELYEQKHAWSFAEVYRNRPVQEEVVEQPWEITCPPPSVTDATRNHFYGFVEYQMSLGLPFLVNIYRRSLEKTRWEDLPVQKLWTQSFLSKASGIWFFRGTGGSFELTPVEDGKKGYRLELVVRSSSDDYKLDFLDPIFTEADFKPTDMGGLTGWRQDGKVDRFVVRSVEGRQEKGAGIRLIN